MTRKSAPGAEGASKTEQQAEQSPSISSRQSSARAVMQGISTIMNDVASSDRRSTVPSESTVFEYDSSVHSADNSFENEAAGHEQSNLEQQDTSPLESAAQGTQAVQQQQQQGDDITLQEAFQEVQQAARTLPFPIEPYAPSYLNVVTMTGTVSTQPELQELRSGTDVIRFMMRVRRPGTSMVDTYGPCRHHLLASWTVFLVINECVEHMQA
jgi:hypothetical protein